MVPAKKIPGAVADSGLLRVGWLPALLWVLFGSIFIGAVHDLGALVVSLRNNGQTVGDIWRQSVPGGSGPPFQLAQASELGDGMTGALGSGIDGDALEIQGCHRIHGCLVGGVERVGLPDLAARRIAVEIGAGEGRHALWLAGRGWQVTAVDISQVALDRAAAGHPEISWQRADITRTPMPARSFDLVSAFYFPIVHETDHATVRGLLEAVAPGGTLLFVAHDPTEFPPRDEHAHEGGHSHEGDGPSPRFDPYEFYQPSEIVELLGDGWTDALATLNPRGGVWTFWDYQAGAWQRDHGFRIDHLLLSPECADRMVSAGVDKAYRGREKASDHTPVWVELA